MRDFGLEVLDFDGRIGEEGLTRMTFGDRKMDGNENMEGRTGNDVGGKGKKVPDTFNSPVGSLHQHLK